MSCDGVIQPLPIATERTRTTEWIVVQASRIWRAAPQAPAAGPRDRARDRNQAARAAPRRVTSALDPELVTEVLEIIRELKEDGMTMLIASHEMGFARDIADAVCYLDHEELTRE